jgi:hypothetical protein
MLKCNMIHRIMVTGKLARFQGMFDFRGLYIVDGWWLCACRHMAVTGCGSIVVSVLC